MNIEDIANGVDRSAITRDIDGLSEIGLDSEGGGYTRLAFSPEETQVIEFFKDQLGDFEIEEDKIGNVYAVIPSGQEGAKKVCVGSHADSVPNGGNYDGIAGIVAGKEAINAVRSSGIELNHDLVLMILRGEESSRFKHAYLGSSAMFGDVDHDKLKNKNGNDISLESAIYREGFDAGPIEKGNPVLLYDPEDIMAFMELHIEQARLLQEERKDIGIITGIRGALRIKLGIEGSYDHSGATPMYLRQDANMAMAEILHELNIQGMGANLEDENIVWNYGIIENPSSNSINTISGKSTAYFDFRSHDPKKLNEFVGEFKRYCPRIAQRYGCKTRVKEMSYATPVAELDSDIIKMNEKIADQIGLKHVKMPSGAGHDAAVFAKHNIPTGMIFIPCRNGVSHDSHEYTSTDNIYKGAQMLAGTLTSLATDL